MDTPVWFLTNAIVQHLTSWNRDRNRRRRIPSITTYHGCTQILSDRGRGSEGGSIDCNPPYGFDGEDDICKIGYEDVEHMGAYWRKGITRVKAYTTYCHCHEETKCMHRFCKSNAFNCTSSTPWDCLSYIALVSGDPSYVAGKPSHPMLLWQCARPNPQIWLCHQLAKGETPDNASEVKQRISMFFPSRFISTSNHNSPSRERRYSSRKGKNVRPLQCSFHAKVLKRYHVKRSNSQAEKLNLPKLPGLVLVFLGFTPLLESNPNVVI